MGPSFAGLQALKRRAYLLAQGHREGFRACDRQQEVTGSHRRPILLLGSTHLASGVGDMSSSRKWYIDFNDSKKTSYGDLIDLRFTASITKLC